MKKLILIILMIVCFQIVQAQSTFILIRHAEKDTSNKGSTTMNANPPLSQKGKERAKKLADVLNTYTINEIYSTNFIRTANTVTPLAIKNNIQIKFYNHKKLVEFANQLLLEKNKTIVIAGHNTTTPALTNLLLKQNKFTALKETEYDKIFIVSINNMEATVKVIEY